MAGLDGRYRLGTRHTFRVDSKSNPVSESEGIWNVYRVTDILDGILYSKESSLLLAYAWIGEIEGKGTATETDFKYIPRLSGIYWKRLIYFSRTLHER